MSSGKKKSKPLVAGIVNTRTPTKKTRVPSPPTNYYGPDFPCTGYKDSPPPPFLPISFARVVSGETKHSEEQSSSTSLSESQSNDGPTDFTPTPMNGRFSRAASGNTDKSEEVLALDNSMDSMEDGGQKDPITPPPVNNDLRRGDSSGTKSEKLPTPDPYSGNLGNNTLRDSGPALLTSKSKKSYSAATPSDDPRDTSPTHSPLPSINPVLSRAVLGRSATNPTRNTKKTPLANVSTTRSKKGLSVDSPSFTPATLPAPTGKTIPSQAVNAPSFTPRNQGTPTPGAQSIAQSATLKSQFKEFKPQGDYASHASSNGTGSEAQMSFDLFSSHSTVTPYANEQYFGDNSHVANGAGGYFTGPSGYAANVQPLQHHLYAPVGPHRLEIQPYQRHAHDFFMDEGVREELQRKSEASLQVMPNSSIQLPSVDVYHTLVALDTNHQDSNHQKLLVLGGYPSWVYKAISSKDGKIYCLRRLKGFKLTNPSAMQAVGEWHRVNNGAIVNVHKTFTTSVFGDSSLIFVTDYHPLSKTLIEHHSAGTGRYGSQRSQALVPEQDIWGYVVQIASAMKSIHQANLAVRCMDASKILVTSKNRIRLNACSMLDVVQFNPQWPLAELQQEDFKNFGELILRVATNTLASRTTWTAAQTQALMDQMARSYTIELVDTCKYLLGKQPKDLNDFLRGIHGHTMDVYNSLMHAEDTCTSELHRELENGRIARLLMKLGTINERPEYEGQLAWSELGGRYQLKLFRDYVFHQVDSNGNAVVDLGHILTQLNRLDAGSDQKIRLVSRDESAEWIVTYKELKKEVEAAFGELTKQASSRGGRGF